MVGVGPGCGFGFFHVPLSLSLCSEALGWGGADSFAIYLLARRENGEFIRIYYPGVFGVP